jgi:hypothetical protein
MVFGTSAIETYMKIGFYMPSGNYIVTPAAEDVPSVDGTKGGCSAASKGEGGGSMRTSAASELWELFLISSSAASLCCISISLKLVPAAAVLVLVLASEVMEDCRG